MSKSSLVKAQAPFTMVLNDLLNSSDLSLSAKGLYAYMYSKPDNWTFTIKSITSQLKDSQYAIEKAMKELKDQGWITYKKYTSGAGKYTLNLEPNLPNHDIRDLGQNTKPNHEVRDQACHDVLIKKKEQKKKLKKTNKKEVAEKDVLKPAHENQLVSDSFSFFDEENKSKATSLPFGFVEASEEDKKESIKEDLLGLGLTPSQIKSVLRVHSTDLIDQAIIETHHAEVEQRINDKASQYFYGVLRNLSSEKKLA